jgi:hypothetical protein
MSKCAGVQMANLNNYNYILWVFMGVFKPVKFVIASDSVAIANYANPSSLCAIASFLAMTKLEGTWVFMGILNTSRNPFS